jgi:hypothetical protein
MNRHLGTGESSAAAQRDAFRRSLQTAHCVLCGTLLPVSLMVPDGGQACADIRWYCKDTRSCTDRWTADLPHSARVAPAAGVREMPEEQPPDAGFDETPAEPVSAGEAPAVG